MGHLLPDDGDDHEEDTGAGHIGPMTMEDVARFRERFIAQVDATQASALRHWCRANVVHATSHYSGFGMFEAALAAFLETDGRMPQLRVFHASDIARACRKALLNHTAQTAPLHIGGDICRRAPPPQQEKLKACWQEAGQAWAAELKCLIDDGSHAAMIKDAKQCAADKLLAQLLEVLREAPLLTEDFCYKCKALCPLHGHINSRRHPSRSRVLTVNSAGTTCVDHSSMGSHAGLLGKTIIPFTIWLKERMENREDLIIHECTQHHPSELLFNRFLGPSHHIFVWKICPSELGFPLTRVRKFTLCVSRARLLDMVPLTTPLQFFGARVVAKGSIFFAESQTHPQIMCLGDFGRLRRYKELMEEAGMPETADLLVNVTQAPEYGAITTLVPCLLKRTKLWSMGRARLLTGSEVRRVDHKMLIA